MTQLNQAAKDTLEMLIDHNSLDAVLDALSVICAEKAEHLTSNWQDKAAARDWIKASNLVDATAGRITRLALAGAAF